MQAVHDNTLLDRGAGALDDELAVHHPLDLLPPIPADFPAVHGVDKNIPDGSHHPIAAHLRGNLERVEAADNQGHAQALSGAVRQQLPGGVEVIYQPDYLGLLRDDFEGKALVAFQLYAAVAVGGLVADVLALLDGGNTPALQAAVDGLILAPGHEKPKLEILLVVLVCWVVDLEGGDDFRVGEFERLRDDALVDGVATGQTLDLHHQHPLPRALFHLGEEPLHDRPGGDSLAGDNFPIDFRHVVMAALGDLQKGLFVPGQRLTLATGLGFCIGAGLAQIHTERHENHLLCAVLWGRVKST